MNREWEKNKKIIKKQQLIFLHNFIPKNQKGGDMEKGRKYRLFVLCIRRDNRVIKIRLHAAGKYANNKEARERLWHIARKDLCGFFDHIFCLVQGNWKIMTFRFPERRA